MKRDSKISCFFIFNVMHTDFEPIKYGFDYYPLPFIMAKGLPY